MSHDAKTLEQRLVGEPPDGIAALPAEQRQRLADAIGAQRRRQGMALTAAAEESLRYVPKLMRGPVRKAVGL